MRPVRRSCTRFTSRSRTDFDLQLGEGLLRAGFVPEPDKQSSLRGAIHVTCGTPPASSWPPTHSPKSGDGWQRNGGRGMKRRYLRKQAGSPGKVVFFIPLPPFPCHPFPLSGFRIHDAMAFSHTSRASFFFAKAGRRRRMHAQRKRRNWRSVAQPRTCSSMASGSLQFSHSCSVTRCPLSCEVGSGKSQLLMRSAGARTEDQTAEWSFTQFLVVNPQS